MELDSKMKLSTRTTKALRSDLKIDVDNLTRDEIRERLLELGTRRILSAKTLGRKSYNELVHEFGLDKFKEKVGVMKRHKINNKDRYALMKDYIDKKAQSCEEASAILKAIEAHDLVNKWKYNT